MRSSVNMAKVENALSERALSSRQELVEAIACVSSGDKTAFELVYAATSAKLYGIITRIVGRRDVADDVLQEVYVRVWQRAAEFDPTSASPITWLASIARDRALDQVRRNKMRLFDECSEVLQRLSGDDPLTNYEQDEKRRRLLACLDLLGLEKKLVFLQTYYYGMTHDEIAQRVGLPVSAVKSWLRRSLSELKGHLEE